MRLNPYKILALPALLSCLSAGAQSVGPSEMNAAGRSAVAAGNVHEFAIGSVVGLPATLSPSLVVTPGVLQPEVATGVPGHGIPADALHVYPSPMETTLFLDPAFGTGGSLVFTLVDAAGKTVLNRAIALQRGDERQALDVRELAAGSYFLQVSWTESRQPLTSASYKLQKLR